VTFYWNESSDHDIVTYTVEVDDNFNFTTVQPSHRHTGLIGNKCTMELEEGEYFWRVKAVDDYGNESPWDISAYPFRVGVVSRDMLMIAGIAVCVLLIIILLTRAVSVARRP
jgi:hypothetical protein